MQQIFLDMGEKFTLKFKYLVFGQIFNQIFNRIFVIQYKSLFSATLFFTFILYTFKG